MSTYQDLNLAVQALLNEASTELDAYMPTAVRLAEQGIYGAMKSLECFKSSTEETFTGGMDMEPIDSSTEKLETIRSVSVEWTDGDGNKHSALLEKKVDDFSLFWGDAEEDPQFYAITGRTASNITYAVFPWRSGQEYTLKIRGFGEIEKLDPQDNNSQTWLSVNAFDCLMYGTALHAATFLKDKQLAELYAMQYSNCMRDLAQANGLQYNTEAAEGAETEETE